MNYLELIVAYQKFGEARGMTSVCSAHPYALEATLLHGLSTAPQLPVLIESTCNQVNQFGGYTGMKPADFTGYVHEIADKVGFPQQNLILGGDHLGPLVWFDEPADRALEKAKILVQQYVGAGFNKLHLDCSTPCRDDQELPVEVMAHRVAELASVAEVTAASCNSSPRYIIGTEVPTAGGANATAEQLVVTNPADAARTIELTRRAFSAKGLDSAWERVIGLVVQPGVEFGDETIHEYDPSLAVGLSRFIEAVPELVYEAHSTDYQTRSALRSLVEDHFAFLKVGPGVTFAFREAVFALADMEKILFEADFTSHLLEILEAEMLKHPVHWQKHYAGPPERQKFARFYSFSDRIRYYWPVASVNAAFEKLLLNLGDKALPLSLLSEYMPRQYEKIRKGEIQNRPRSLLLGQIMDVLNDYTFACGHNRLFHP